MSMPIVSDIPSSESEQQTTPSTANRSDPMPGSASDVIYFERVSVRYRVPREKVSGIKEFAIRWLQRRVEYQDFYALREVSFQIRSGEIFGVVGRNGAGKSTLLKVMARVLYPFQGRLVMRGRVAPLLELGGGFHPELTGRENIYLNMALLGHSRQQARDLFDSIIDFAEIGNFIEAPIRTYSTGMVARLGFAVATCLRPDILLVDEVLSVGDSWFQEKCLERMYSFQRQGTTIVIVSHAMAAIETMCSRAMWLDNGQVCAIGLAAEVIEQYHEMEQRGVPRSSTDLQDGLATNNPEEPIEILPVPERVHGTGGDFIPFDQIGGIYPAQEILNVMQGTVSVWVKLMNNEPRPVAAIFHTDDSRYVLSVTSEHLGFENRTVRKIVARAGGNRRAFDTFYGTSEFPEATAWVIRPEETGKEHGSVVPCETSILPGRVDLHADAWHLLVMTWLGYPTGVVRLYVNGQLINEKTYDPRHDRGDHLPAQLAIGIRPANWRGELIRKEDGSLLDLRPYSTMSLVEGGLAIRDLRLYGRALDQDELTALLDN